MLKRFMAYYKPHMRLFILDMCATLMISICDLVYPIITRNLLNDYIPNQKLRVMLVAAGLLLLIYVVKMILTYFVQYYGHLVGVYMQADMRRDIFNHLQKLPFSYYDEHETGTIMSRMINDLMDISELAHHGPEDFFISLIMMIGAFCYLCTINVQSYLYYLYLYSVFGFISL